MYLNIISFIPIMYMYSYLLGHPKLLKFNYQLIFNYTQPPKTKCTRDVLLTQHAHVN